MKTPSWRTGDFPIPDHELDAHYARFECHDPEVDWIKDQEAEAEYREMLDAEAFAYHLREDRGR